MTARGCDHIGILTLDADRLVRFYCHKLGFGVAKDEIVAAAVMKPIFGVAGDCRLVKLVPRGPAGKGVSIEIFSYLRATVEKRRARAAGYNHWGFRVGNRRRLVERLRCLKVPVIEVRRGDHSVYFIRDPDGNRIEIRD